MIHLQMRYYVPRKHTPSSVSLEHLKLSQLRRSLQKGACGAKMVNASEGVVRFAIDRYRLATNRVVDQ